MEVFTLKKVVSVSLGSSKRDHKVEVSLLGETIEISRRGTDGDFKKALEVLKELDGKVDAIGLGGIDLYLYAGERKYTIKDGLKMLRVLSKTPAVDGSGLKNTLERNTVNYLIEKKLILPKSKVLMVSGVDRFGMGEAFVKAGSRVVFGDLIFALGIDYPINSLKNMERLARIILPVITRLPFKMIYPTGKKQEGQNEKKRAKFGHYYKEAEIIAGDFHLIKKYLPSDLKGQMVVTNTTTKDDLKFLKKCGVGTLVTTTPVLEGRSFGTNVMEAVLVALLEKNPSELTFKDYLNLLAKMEAKPTINNLVGE